MTAEWSEKRNHFIPLVDHNYRVWRGRGYSLMFYSWLLKLFTAWCQILFLNWSAEGNQQDIPLRSSKKVMLEVPSNKILPTLGGRAFCYAAPKLWTTYLVKYPALTLCQIWNAMWKHIFLNKLIICGRVFVTFILSFIIYYHFDFIFISFLNLSTCL